MPRKKKVPDNDRRAAYLAGKITVSDMDDEELARGKFRDKGGLFRGTTPNMPPRFATELARETMLRFNDKFRGALLSITNEQIRLALSAEKEEVRMKAGQYAIDRLAGKPTEKVALAHGTIAEWEGAVDDFVEVMGDEKVQRARHIASLDPKELAARPMIDSTSRVRTDDEALDDEVLIRQILDEEIAAEIVDGPGEATG